MGRAAFELLESLQRDAAHEFVFPNATSTGHFVGLPRVWARITRRANITGVTLHGLRHWFASVAAKMNYSELTIAGILGHRVKGVTARYATSPDSALLAAADRVSCRISEILDRALAKNSIIVLNARSR
jgi:integrase